MLRFIDNVLIEFYILLYIAMMPVIQHIYILCIILWLSPNPWDAPVDDMEVNKWNETYFWLHCLTVEGTIIYNLKHTVWILTDLISLSAGFSNWL
jgi:hypothetical protein